jgi:hypothetical protein
MSSDLMQEVLGIELYHLIRRKAQAFCALIQHFMMLASSGELLKS